MRLALSIFTACGLAFLTGCGSGFSGIAMSTTPANVVLTPDSAQADDFFVIPGGTAPLSISAISYTGTGTLASVVPDVTYTWAARFVNPLTDPVSVATYSVGNTGTAPSSFKSCPAMPSITGPVPILVQGGTGTVSTLYPTYRLLAPTATATEIAIGPVPGVVAPYCLLVEARSVPGGVIGGATVIVSASP